MAAFYCVVSNCDVEGRHIFLRVRFYSCASFAGLCDT